MNKIIIAAAWFFIGMLCFYHMADFTQPQWAKGFYLWDKAKDVLFALCITYCVPEYGKQFKIILYFCIIRLLWEIAADFINIDINNSMVINWLFIMFLAIWIYQSIREWRR